MKKLSSKKLSEFVEPYMLITPLLVLLAVFILYPVIANIFMSFYKWNGIKKPEFIGIANYKEMFTDEKFWGSLKNTAILLLYIPLPQVHFRGPNSAV